MKDEKTQTIKINRTEYGILVDNSAILIDNSVSIINDLEYITEKLGDSLEYTQEDVCRIEKEIKFNKRLRRRDRWRRR